MTASTTIEQPAAAAPSGSTPRSLCLYTPSADPSGMGAHMLDLAAELAGVLDVSLMARTNDAGRRALARAEAVGARPVPLLHPRDPGFADGIVAHLRAHPADVFHVHVATGREDFGGARAARAAGVGAVVQTLHFPWRMGSVKHRVPFFRSLREVDHLITVSQAQRRTYEQIGVDSRRTTTVPNGVRPRQSSPGRAAARAALGLSPGQPVVLTVGRLNVMKGHRYLVDAVAALAAQVPDLAVVVVGGGHLHAELQAQAASLGVAHVVSLPGQRADARGLLDAADVFVLPSRHEGMPLALLEAMEAGLPVVATRVIGIEEVVEHGRTGLLVRPRDPAALGSALGQLLADADLRRAMGRAGRRRYQAGFTSRLTAQRTLAVYEDVLARVRDAGRAPVGSGA